ncbi:hypothetical protein BC834DRAFT_857559 [Gloeopeniophorella convolvens]|nr:hypothetical protein BC834DRAFT_857559 [Gloeopeniophorella convolvens]
MIRWVLLPKVLKRRVRGRGPLSTRTPGYCAECKIVERHPLGAFCRNLDREMTATVPTPGQGLLGSNPLNRARSPPSEAPKINQRVDPNATERGNVGDPCEYVQEGWPRDCFVAGVVRRTYDMRMLQSLWRMIISTAGPQTTGHANRAKPWLSPCVYGLARLS